MSKLDNTGLCADNHLSSMGNKGHHRKVNSCLFENDIGVYLLQINGGDTRGLISKKALGLEWVANMSEQNILNKYSDHFPLLTPYLKI